MISGNTKLGWLMHDFSCSNPDEMYYSEMAETARYWKENPKGVKTMCESMEQLRAESEKIGEKRGLEKGRLEGQKEERINIISELIHDGILTLNEALKRFDISEEDLQSVLHSR